MACDTGEREYSLERKYLLKETGQFFWKERERENKWFWIERQGERGTQRERAREIDRDI